MSKTIFLLEDEKNIQQLIKYNLESSGYEVSFFSTGKELFEAFNKSVPSLLLLDIMLPDTDGYQVLTKMKTDVRLKNIPVIMLTAKKEEFDKVLGLEMGCEDYITKPFSIRELIARIKVVLRRNESSSIEKPVILEYKDLKLDIMKHELYKNGELIKLPLKEFLLLEALMENQGMVFSRNQLLEKIWGFDFFGETRTVDVHIRYLRIHIGDENGRYIETVRGIGYKLY